jgi:hypothetical protein
MLQDTDRNAVFEKAIAILVGNFAAKVGRSPIVLDIGAGTGLLSMLCKRSGAEFVFGVEMFDVLANVAQQVIGANNFEDEILIVKGKSTDIALPVLPDLIVSELLDSALVGESCIPSHADAIDRLLRSDIPSSVLPLESRVLPHSATVFATVVQSEEVASMWSPPQWTATLSSRRLNEQSEDCAFMHPLLPVHWKSIEKRGPCKLLSSSVPVLRFDFFRASNTTTEETEAKEEEGEGDRYGFGEGTFVTDIEISKDGIAHGLLLWWSTRLLSPELDPVGEFTYCTAPGAQNWQDHWLQTVFPLPVPLNCCSGDVVRVTAAHNATKIWLEAVKVETEGRPSKKPKGPPPRRPEKEGEGQAEGEGELLSLHALDPSSRLLLRDCSCGWHLLCNSDRLQMLNDPLRTAAWTTAISLLVRTAHSLAAADILRQDDRKEGQQHYIMDISDGSLLALIAARELKDTVARMGETGTVRVVSREKKLFSRMFHGQLAEANEVEEFLMMWNGESIEDIPDYFASNDAASTALGSEEQGEEVDAQTLPLGSSIVALVGECFYYQLRSRSTWQALSYHYQRTALESLLHPDAVVLPHRALVMAAVFEMRSLYESHGEVGE